MPCILKSEYPLVVNTVASVLLVEMTGYIFWKVLYFSHLSCCVTSASMWVVSVGDVLNGGG